MAYRLRGGRTVEEWQNAMSSREFRRWLWWFRKRDRDDLARREKTEFYLAQIAMYVAISGGAKKVTLERFLLDFTGRKGKAARRVQDWEEQKAVMTAAFRAMGAKTGPLPGAMSGSRQSDT